MHKEICQNFACVLTYRFSWLTFKYNPSLPNLICYRNRSEVLDQLANILWNIIGSLGVLFEIQPVESIHKNANEVLPVRLKFKRNSFDFYILVHSISVIFFMVEANCPETEPSGLDETGKMHPTLPLIYFNNVVKVFI